MKNNNSDSYMFYSCESNGDSRRYFQKKTVDVKTLLRTTNGLLCKNCYTVQETLYIDGYFCIHCIDILYYDKFTYLFVVGIFQDPYSPVNIHKKYILKITLRNNIFDINLVNLDKNGNEEDGETIEKNTNSGNIKSICGTSN